MSSAENLAFVVKVCGITNEADAQMAVEAGANALGFNFYTESPRYITPDHARRIIRTVKGPFLRVGVFVNATEGELASAVDQSGLDIVQLHGNRCPSQLPSSYRVWRSIVVAEKTVSRLAEAEAYVLDTPSLRFGGSGRSFDWSLAAAFPHRKIIAGGLDGTNVGDAIRIALPWGVDACSRLESTPGRKDRNRVRDFIRQALIALPKGVSSL
jgi:phosphoribosylanthranilate isomerase